MVAITIKVPAAVVESIFPLTVPPVSPAEYTLQTIVLFVALAGATAPVNVKGMPTVAVDGTPVMPVTGSITVTAIVFSVAAVSLNVTLIVVVPAAAAVTVMVPLDERLASSTVATPESLEVMVATVAFVEPAPSVTLKVPVLPVFKLRLIVLTVGTAGVTSVVKLPRFAFPAVALPAVSMYAPSAILTVYVFS